VREMSAYIPTPNGLVQILKKYITWYKARYQIDQELEKELVMDIMQQLLEEISETYEEGKELTKDQVELLTALLIYNELQIRGIQKK
jgi:hypothetical protein